MERTVDLCPILQYTSVRLQNHGNTGYCTTADKLEYDLRSLLENGYTAVSLQEYRAGSRTKSNCFSVILVGGYEDAYTAAFPILRKYNVPAAAFVPTDLIGVKEYLSVPNFTPHFGWREAQEMVDSGLVHVYPMWHPFDSGKAFMPEMRRKVELLNANLFGNGEIFAVFGCELRKAEFLKTLGINLLLTGCLNLKETDLKKGAAPAVAVEYTEDALDVLDKFDLLCCEMLKKTQMLYTEATVCRPNPALLTDSVLLPYDRYPRVKNYLRHAFVFSVMQADDPYKAERQIVNVCIDTICKPQYECFDYHNASYEMWECIDSKMITRELLEINGLSAVDYIINGLKLGYYTDIWLDTYYIPDKLGYQSVHQGHGILIYGFDAPKQTFLALSYTDKMQFCEIAVHIENIVKATSNLHFTQLNLFRVRKDVGIRYEIRQLYAALEDYLHSVHHASATDFNKVCDRQYVQAEASAAFAAHIAGCFSEKRGIHRVAMYGYTEHKRVMFRRICYIAEREKLDVAGLQLLCQENTKTAEWLMTASLKYNVKPSERLLHTIVEKMKRLNSCELVAIETLLHLLKNKYPWI